MDFTFSEEHRLLESEVRKFCEKQIKPYARKLDREEMLPYEHFKALASHGFFAPSVPAQYGGHGADLLSSFIIGKEIARVCPSTGLSVGASVLLFGGTVHSQGNDEQKLRYLVPIARAEKIGCWGMTEPDAGSDITSIRTTAVRDGDHYVLNGTKTFITNAPHADFFVVYALTTRGAGHNGMTAFILERGMKGLTTSKPMEKMGMRGSPTGEIYMEDVRVHRSQMLGHENRGFWEALPTLSDERALAPAMCLGMMERCLEDSIRYAEQRVQFGKPISHKQAIQFKIARMYTLVEHVRMMAYRLLWMKEQKIDFTKEASAAKLFASESAVHCALEAIQIMGGYGYMQEFEVERFMRDAKLLEIGGGTSEIQQKIIAGFLLREMAGGKAEAPPAPEKIKEKPEKKEINMADITCKDIFEAIPGRFKPEGAVGWNACIQFRVAGPKGGDYVITVADQKCSVSQGVAEKPTATVQTDDETWIGMTLGKLDPMQAFFEGKIMVDNIADVQRLNDPTIFEKRKKQE